MSEEQFLHEMSTVEMIHAERQLLVMTSLLVEIHYDALLERLAAADEFTPFIAPDKYLDSPATDDRAKQLARLIHIAWAGKRLKQHILPAGPEQRDPPPADHKYAEHETPHYHQQSFVLVHGEDCLACGYERQLRILAELRHYLGGVAVTLGGMRGRESEAATVRSFVSLIASSTDESKLPDVSADLRPALLRLLSAHPLADIVNELADMCQSDAADHLRAGHLSGVSTSCNRNAETLRIAATELIE